MSDDDDDFIDDSFFGLDIESIPEGEWQVIRKVARTLYDQDDKRNYPKACVLAFVEWLEFTNNQVRH